MIDDEDFDTAVASMLRDSLFVERYPTVDGILDLHFKSAAGQKALAWLLRHEEKNILSGHGDVASAEDMKAIFDDIPQTHQSIYRNI